MIWVASDIFKVGIQVVGCAIGNDFSKSRLSNKRFGIGVEYHLDRDIYLVVRFGRNCEVLDALLASFAACGFTGVEIYQSIFGCFLYAGTLLLGEIFF